MRLAKIVLAHFSFQVQLLLSVKAFDLTLVTRLFHLPFECGIEMIFDVVIGATLEMLGNFRPSVAVLLMKSEDFLIFFLSPLVLLYVGVEVIVPALSALLPYTAWQELSDLRPILGPVLLHALH